MAELDLNKATASDLTNAVEDYDVGVGALDSPSDQKETEWLNSRWGKQLAYFNKIPELKSAILMKATWNVGKGYKTDPISKVVLDHISGWGKDTFDDILFNMEVLKRIGGDAFCEIIRDDKSNRIINLKPLDPSTIKIIVDGKGRILRYEQIDKRAGKEKAIHKFKPEEIFHLCHNRIGDQIHGLSDIDALEEVILAEIESFTDLKKIMHRQAKPMIMFKLGTDVQSKIDAFVAKMDAATNKGENIYVPDDENAVSFEVIQVNIAPNTLSWRDDLKSKFYRAIGLPQIIFGSGQVTESGGKIEYLAHEQVFEKEQRFIEKQIEKQLGLKINLLPPTSLLPNLVADESKDSQNALTLQKNDITKGVGQDAVQIGKAAPIPLA